jgi:hypothetical protein
MWGLGDFPGLPKVNFGLSPAGPEAISAMTTVSLPLLIWRLQITGPQRALHAATRRIYLDNDGIPGLVNIQKTMENHHAINGKTHYKWSFSIVFCMFTRG